MSATLSWQFWSTVPTMVMLGGRLRLRAGCACSGDAANVTSGATRKRTPISLRRAAATSKTSFATRADTLLPNEFLGFFIFFHPSSGFAVGPAEDLEAPSELHALRA